MNALLEIIQTLAVYSQWRDGCPDCGSEDRVSPDRGPFWSWESQTFVAPPPGALKCFCGRRWIRGEA